MKMIMLKPYTLRRIVVILLCRGGGSLEDALNNKQDKLTNPLTQSDVVDNLTSTSTKTPLSANQGKILKEYASQLGIDSDYLASHSVTLSGDFTFSDLENSAVPMFFTNWEDSTNFPALYGSGLYIPMLDNRNKVILYAYQTNGLYIRTATASGWNSWARILSSGNVADDLNTYSNINVLSAKQGYIMSRDIPWYGTSYTPTSITAKAATTSDGKFSLVTGAKVTIKFTYGNTASNPTLSVDATGAKSIKAYGTTAPISWWQAGDMVTFTYDGTNWIMGATEGQINNLMNWAPNAYMCCVQNQMVGGDSSGHITYCELDDNTKNIRLQISLQKPPRVVVCMANVNANPNYPNISSHAYYDVYSGFSILTEHNPNTSSGLVDTSGMVAYLNPTGDSVIVLKVLGVSQYSMDLEYSVYIGRYTSLYYWFYFMIL